MSKWKAGPPFQGATTEYNSAVGTGTNKGSGHFQAGYFGGAIFGHKLAPGLSAEVEGVYLKNRYDVATEFTQQTAGHTQTYGGLANLKFSLPYDYHVTQRFGLVPYVAVGAGLRRDGLPDRLRGRDLPRRRPSWAALAGQGRSGGQDRYPGVVRLRLSLLGDAGLPPGLRGARAVRARSS